MKTILVFVSHYLPGYKAGGPLRTIANLVEHLGDEFHFKIVTGDRDFEDTQPYPGVITGEWNRVGAAEVYYMSSEMQNASSIYHLLNSTDYDILYLNSFFAARFTIFPLLLRRVGVIPDKPLVLAPRGEFSPGALALKSLKKRSFLGVAQILKLYSHILWHASSELERKNLQENVLAAFDVQVALNLPPKADLKQQTARARKIPNLLRVVFLSRISPMKNLDGALKILEGIQGTVHFDIYGPISDPSYWAECQKIIGSIESKLLTITYCGTVEHDQVFETFKQYDLFLLPTHGENYGHVIHESLVAGCPVLISDQTPWQDLEDNYAGWVCAAGDVEAYRSEVMKCIEMDNEEHQEWAQGAHRFGVKV